MTIDSTTGQVAWIPAEGDLGVHPIILQVEDGRGGRAEQRYFLAVTETLPNRPPYFVSVPVTEARFGHEYVYHAQAVDPDSDPIEYSLIEEPDGMAIQPSTGMVTWLPIVSTMGFRDVVIEASDGHGGTAQQSFIVQVSLESRNQAPLITSEPITWAIQGLLYTYFVEAFDPDDDILQYVLVDAPQGMTIHATTGEIHWPTANYALGVYAVRVTHQVRCHFAGDSNASNSPPYLTSQRCLLPLLQKAIMVLLWTPYLSGLWEQPDFTRLF